MTTYAVTGASGQLGRKVLDALLERVDASTVVALAREPAKLGQYARQGIEVRHADYDDPASLERALEGINRVLLISGNVIGQRERQHGNVIQAAKNAGVEYVAYTSILNAQESKLPLATEHAATEKLLDESGLNFDLLRNGWYSENFVGSLPRQVEAGAIYGASGEGRYSTATRADFAAGAAAALVGSKGGETYELAGDESWTMEEFAEEVSRRAGKSVKYVDQSEKEYARTLESAGFPAPVAAMLASTSVLAGEGELENNECQLSQLSGQPTTPIRETIAAALSK